LKNKGRSDEKIHPYKLGRKHFNQALPRGWENHWSNVPELWAIKINNISGDFPEFQ